MTYDRKCSTNGRINLLINPLGTTNRNEDRCHSFGVYEISSANKGNTKSQRLSAFPKHSGLLVRFKEISKQRWYRLEFAGSRMLEGRRERIQGAWDDWYTQSKHSPRHTQPPGKIISVSLGRRSHSLQDEGTQKSEKRQDKRVREKRSAGMIFHCWKDGSRKHRSPNLNKVTSAG
ncbi:uncharacterized protein LOC107262949 isoform X2 [Cephus cinctus]|uniref:Uncharacterized protein LOC107262949 isoform X2 n=1 Tax=Cephus cinctus TaxID=211228 RepID=A0AAJ7R8C3_CEPCN|nr:uncharacterized protein LOC107262949 isoform X2 [Cephus cinctus]